jgi:hypothetical protein
MRLIKMAKFGSFAWLKEDVVPEVTQSLVYYTPSHGPLGSIVDDNEFVITIKPKYVDKEGVTKITEAIIEMLERTKDD